MNDALLFHRLALRVVKDMGAADRGHALLVTSARPGEGKSYVAEGLARALSQQALGRVALVECSTARGAPDANGPTFSGFVNAGASDDQFGNLLTGGALSRLPFGAGDDATLYRTKGVLSALDWLRGRFALVILDGPDLAACGGLTEHANACLLVINASRTRREIVKGSLQSNAFGATKLLGAVLNERPEHVPRWLYRRAL